MCSNCNYSSVVYNEESNQYVCLICGNCFEHICEMCGQPYDDEMGIGICKDCWDETLNKE